MVAPVQGSVGKTSSAPETQDYLTELTNFYGKPENQGVESEFTAPDGSKFTITDASYLSNVKSNVNTGKFDTADTGKTVDKNADMSLDSKKTGESEYEKNKAKGSKEEQNPVQNADQAESGADSSASQAENARQGRGNVENVNTKPEEVQASGSQAAAEGNQITADSEKKVQESGKKLKESKQKDKQEDAKMNASTQKTDAMYAAAMTKLEAKIDKAKSSGSDSEPVEDASEQSGDNKMGFAGKLMTTGGSVDATDAAWAETMAGPQKEMEAKFQKQQATLANAKQAGAKAAEQYEAAAGGFDQASEKNLKDAKVTDFTAVVQFTEAGVGAIKGVAELTGGTAKTAEGTQEVATGTPLLPSPLTFWAGVAKITKGVFNFIKSIAHYIKSASAFITSASKGYEGAMSIKAAKGLRTESQKNIEQAEAQRTQGAIARRKTIAQIQQGNAQKIAAVQQINSMLSTSSMPGVTVNSQEQLEAVKKDRYDQIMAHEQAHAAVCGGSPVIQYDANGVAIGGYVDIDVPSLDENDLEGTIDKAQMVINAALAPSDPSSQDQNIASQAKSVLSQAQSKLEEKAAKADEDKDTKETDKTEKAEEKKETEEAKEKVENAKTTK